LYPRPYTQGTSGGLVYSFFGSFPILPGFRIAIIIVSHHALGGVVVFLTYQKKLASHILPFGPMCLMNFGITPSSPAALPFFKRLKVISMHATLKFCIISDLSTQLLTIILYSFLIFVFSYF